MRADHADSTTNDACNSTQRGAGNIKVVDPLRYDNIVAIQDRRILFLSPNSPNCQAQFNRAHALLVLCALDVGLASAWQ